MSDDWLDTETGGLPAVIELPVDYASRAALAEACWARLEPRQKLFLQAWRECNFNARAAERQTGVDRHIHSRGQLTSDYAMVVRIWQANAAASALDKDRLLARHDSIVEQALEPKLKLDHGVPVKDPRDPTGERYIEEVDVGAARSANADLLQAAGVLKTGKDVEVNVGVAIQVGPPTLNIQVLPLPPSKLKQNENVVIDAKFTEVPSDEWLDA